MVDQICVKVTNYNDFDEPIVDHHDGVAYTFPTGKPVKIPLVAAEHIFGFHDGKADFLHVQRRWGWNVKNVNLERARDWFNNILVEPVAVKAVELPPGVTEEHLQEALAAVTREPLPDAGIRREVHE
jgi:hypothetical protein